MTVEADHLGVRSTSFVSALLVLVGLAQVAVVGYVGGRQGARLMWSALALLPAAALALHHLLRGSELRRHGLLLGAALAVALWLGVVQFTAMAPEFGLRNTWMWWSALLLVPVARLAWQLGFGQWLLLALVVPAGLHGLWLAGVSLASPMGYAVIGQDPNILADRVVLLLVAAMAGYGMLTMSAARRGTPGLLLPLLLALAVVSAVLMHQGLNARAGMGLLLASSVVLALLQNDRRLWLLPLAIAVAYALPWLFPEWANFRQSGAATRVSLAALEDLGTGSTREALRDAAWSMLPMAGLTGLGFGGFALLYPQMRGADDGTHGVLVHNDFLQLLIEAGPPMLLAVLAFAGVCAWAGCRVAWRLWTQRGGDGQDPDLLLACAALLGVGVVLAHAFINFPLFDPALLNITLAAGVIGTSAACSGAPGAATIGPEGAEEANGTGSDEAARLARLASFGVLVLLAGFWLYAGGQTLAQVTLMTQYSPFPGVSPPDLTAHARARWADRLQALGLGYGLPAYSQAHFVAVLRAERGGSLPPEVEAFALERFETAMRASPFNERIYVDYAAFLAETGRGSLDDRLAILERGLEYRPMGPQLWWAIAHHRAEAGQWEPVAAATTEDWFRVCHFAAYHDLRAARGFYHLIPDSVRELHDDEMARCGAVIDRVISRGERMRELQRQAATNGRGVG